MTRAVGRIVGGCSAGGSAPYRYTCSPRAMPRRGRRVRLPVVHMHIIAVMPIDILRCPNAAPLIPADSDRLLREEHAVDVQHGKVLANKAIRAFMEELRGLRSGLS